MLEWSGKQISRVERIHPPYLPLFCNVDANLLVSWALYPPAEVGLTKCLVKGDRFCSVRAPLL
jgi:hypothetical protein